ncbi:MAG TPA: hypothetical protein DF383_04005, partial [Deltaproteobacteria bacterium]|nr:hypothetical protein [Deltaproteobacteria bacterium]
MSGKMNQKEISELFEQEVLQLLNIQMLKKLRQTGKKSDEDIIKQFRPPVEEFFKGEVQKKIDEVKKDPEAWAKNFPVKFMEDKKELSLDEIMQNIRAVVQIAKDAPCAGKILKVFVDQADKNNGALVGDVQKILEDCRRTKNEKKGPTGRYDEYYRTLNQLVKESKERELQKLKQAVDNATISLSDLPGRLKTLNSNIVPLSLQEIKKTEKIDIDKIIAEAAGTPEVLLRVLQKVDDAALLRCQEILEKPDSIPFPSEEVKQRTVALKTRKSIKENLKDFSPEKIRTYLKRLLQALDGTVMAGPVLKSLIEHAEGKGDALFTGFETGTDHAEYDFVIPGRLDFSEGAFVGLADLKTRTEELKKLYGKAGDPNAPVVQFSQKISSDQEKERQKAMAQLLSQNDELRYQDLSQNDEIRYQARMEKSFESLKTILEEEAGVAEWFQFYSERIDDYEGFLKDEIGRARKADQAMLAKATDSGNVRHPGAVMGVVGIRAWNYAWNHWSDAKEKPLYVGPAEKAAKEALQAFQKNRDALVAKLQSKKLQTKLEKLQAPKVTHQALLEAAPELKELAKNVESQTITSIDRYLRAQIDKIRNMASSDEKLNKSSTLLSRAGRSSSKDSSVEERTERLLKLLDINKTASDEKETALLELLGFETQSSGEKIDLAKLVENYSTVRSGVEYEGLRADIINSLESFRSMEEEVDAKDYIDNILGEHVFGPMVSLGGLVGGEWKDQYTDGPFVVMQKSHERLLEELERLDPEDHDEILRLQANFTQLSNAQIQNLLQEIYESASNHNMGVQILVTMGAGMVSSWIMGAAMRGLGLSRMAASGSSWVKGTGRVLTGLANGGSFHLSSGMVRGAIYEGWEGVSKAILGVWENPVEFLGEAWGNWLMFGMTGWTVKKWHAFFRERIHQWALRRLAKRFSGVPKATIARDVEWGRTYHEAQQEVQQAAKEMAFTSADPLHQHAMTQLSGSKVVEDLVNRGKLARGAAITEQDLIREPSLLAAYAKNRIPLLQQGSSLVMDANSILHQKTLEQLAGRIGSNAVSKLANTTEAALAKNPKLYLAYLEKRIDLKNIYSDPYQLAMRRLPGAVVSIDELEGCKQVYWTYSQEKTSIEALSQYPDWVGGVVADAVSSQLYEGFANYRRGGDIFEAYAQALFELKVWIHNTIFMLSIKGGNAVAHLIPNSVKPHMWAMSLLGGLTGRGVDHYRDWRQRVQQERGELQLRAMLSTQDNPLELSTISRNGNPELAYQVTSKPNGLEHDPQKLLDFFQSNPLVWAGELVNEEPGKPPAIKLTLHYPGEDELEVVTIYPKEESDEAPGGGGPGGSVPPSGLPPARVLGRGRRGRKLPGLAPRVSRPAQAPLPPPAAAQQPDATTSPGQGTQVHPPQPSAANSGVSNGALVPPSAVPPQPDATTSPGQRTQAHAPQPATANSGAPNGAPVPPSAAPQHPDATSPGQGTQAHAPRPAANSPPSGRGQREGSHAPVRIQRGWATNPPPSPQGPGRPDLRPRRVLEIQQGRAGNTAPQGSRTGPEVIAAAGKFLEVHENLPSGSPIDSSRIQSAEDDARLYLGLPLIGQLDATRIDSAYAAFTERWNLQGYNDVPDWEKNLAPGTLEIAR